MNQTDGLVKNQRVNGRKEVGTDRTTMTRRKTGIRGTGGSILTKDVKGIDTVHDLWIESLTRMKSGALKYLGMKSTGLPDIDETGHKASQE